MITIGRTLVAVFALSIVLMSAYFVSHITTVHVAPTVVVHTYPKVTGTWPAITADPNAVITFERPGIRSN